MPLPFPFPLPYTSVAMNLDIKSPVAILGFGVEGQYALAYLEKQGIKDVTICDENENILTNLSLQTRYGISNLTGFATIIRSPGIHYDRPEIKEARDSGVIVTSMTELALEIAKDRITAITGSNGKTTTTALVGEILKTHYNNEVIVGGNDRKPVVQEAIDNPNWPIMMEISSFQLADLHTSPHIAAILNISPNHLDWHETLEDYIHAKDNIIRHQKPDDWAVLNANNEDSAKLAIDAPAQIFWVGTKKGENWALWKNNQLIVNGETIIDHDQIKLKTHPDNIAFAAAIAKLHEVPNETIVNVMKEFEGVEHRLEFVKTVNGIHFCNDSSCTTPESTEVAIDQFPEGKLILLLGGHCKKVDFGFLASKIKNHNVRAYLYGDEGETIKKALEEAGGQDQIIAYNKSGNFEEIMKDVFAQAKPDDNIVLSPACASFDMFNNAKERGKIFKEIVNNL